MDTTTPAFDLTRAPFHVERGAEPGRVAAEMQACFANIERLPDKVSACFAATTACAGVPAGHPFARAGARVARDIDAGLGDGNGNPYHNAQHFCEVLLNALCLSRLVPLPPEDEALLLFAALVHDFHHDGRVVKGVPFRLEKLALSATAPYLDAAGVPAALRERLAAVVLATFVPTGVPFARHCHRHHFAGDLRPEPPADAGSLALLAGDAGLATLAVMLTEADVLSSVGLTVALGDAAQHRIAREMNLGLGPADKLFFLETVFGRFEVGTFFAPNLEAMKREMRDRAAG